MSRQLQLLQALPRPKAKASIQVSGDPFSDAYRVSDSEKHIEGMRAAHINKAMDTLDAAFANDPMFLYMADGQAPTEPVSTLRRAYMKALMRRQISKPKKMAYTIDEGEAFVFAGPPPNDDDPRGPIDSLMDFGKASLRYLQTKEQRKRSKETQAKMVATAEAVLGESKKDMFYVALLATSPASQGRGYGSMLVKAVLNHADNASKRTWLYSSNAANVPFYNSLGFVVVASVLLGDDNETWTEEPVEVHLMVRPVPSEKSEKAFLTEASV